MIKFLINALINAGLVFGTLLAVLSGIYGFFAISVITGELLDDIERKYGFKGSMIAFLVLMVIASIVGAAILTFIFTSVYGV